MWKGECVSYVGTDDMEIRFIIHSFYVSFICFTHKNKV